METGNESPREDIGYKKYKTNPVIKSKSGLVRIRLSNGDVYQYNRETAEWLVRHRKAEYMRNT